MENFKAQAIASQKLAVAFSFSTSQGGHLAQKTAFTIVRGIICKPYCSLKTEYQRNVDKQTTNFEKEFMFVIDVYSVYKYTANTRTLMKIFDLDDIANKDDIISQIEKAM